VQTLVSSARRDKDLDAVASMDVALAGADETVFYNLMQPALPLAIA
jgi:hypothetical protein